MPFKSSIWTPPTESDLENFRRSLFDKHASTGELTPTMVKALAAGLDLSQTAPQDRTLIYDAVANLEGAADIVIPVYGGLHVVKPCIESVLVRTGWPFRLIVVDDCSPDPVTKDYLNSLIERGVDVLYNQKNRGFAATVNRGVRYGENPYVVVLNSDVMVTDKWLVKMLIALESDQKNVICNPVTNNTALINVNMYPGKSYLDMAHALNRTPATRFPDIMPTGFCFMFRRSLWDAIGPLDESYISYGEETDFWFKAIRCVDENGALVGNRAVLADNCYMFHERGTSFQQLGETAHNKQREAGSKRFRALFPEYGEWSKGYNIEETIAPLRTGLTKPLFDRPSKGKFAWVVKSAGGSGGMLVITDIVNQMLEEGYDVKVCVIPDTPHGPQNPAPVLSNLHTQPIIFNNADDFVLTFGQKVFTDGTVFSAVTEITPYLKVLQGRVPTLRCFNHVQSWDPGIAEYSDRQDLLDKFKEGYLMFPNVVCSNWVAREIKAIGGEVIGIPLPGVNPLLFHNREREKNDERFTVGVLINTQYKFKGGDRGIELCQKLVAASKGMDVKVVAIGVNALLTVPGVVCIGNQTPSKMADLMGNELDMFVDPSHIHSYGLPTLEALMSGCQAVVFSDNLGVQEYGNEWSNEKLHVVEKVEEAVEWILTAYQQKHIRAIDVSLVDKFSRYNFVQQFIQTVIPTELKVKASKAYQIEVNSPHFRKHGGPSSNIALANALHRYGHNVTMSMVFTDWNPEVLNMSEVPMRVKWDKVGSDVKAVVINSDNPFAKDIMANNPGKKYIMYKLSHNARFKVEEQNNLNLDWDHIMTSTNHLKQACMKHVEGWEHKLWNDDQITVVGWYHFGHKVFDCNPKNRVYGDSKAGFRVGTLVHNHPLKGTNTALQVIGGLKKKYGEFCYPVAVGEVQRAKIPDYYQFIPFPNRPGLANLMKQFDIWLGCSHTEGLGRMALEAMSTGTICVVTDTGAEFLKDKENCRLWTPGNAQQAAEIIDEIVQNRPLIEKYAWAGYETAVAAANPIKFEAMVNSVIERVINE